MIDVEKLIKQNSELMALLKIIHSFQLNDCWLCAGTIRNYIWDYLSTGNTSSNINLSDIDVIFFDKNIHSPNTEKYISSTDAVSKFPEKCTAIAARLNDNQELEVFIPFGTDDLINFIVSPTPHYFSDKERQTVYNERVKKKNWNTIWPNISIEFIK